MRKGFVLLLLLSFLVILASRGVAAQVEIDTDSVEIELDSETGEAQLPTPTRSPPVSRDTIVYDKEKEAFEKNGYVIRTALPFQKEQLMLDARFSSVKTEFLSLKPNTPVERPVDITISGNNLFSYEVLAWQIDEMKSVNGLVIENTICDIVKTPCTTSLARPWLQTEAHGFGYNLNGVDQPLDFVDKTYFRTFPLATKQERAVVLFNNQLISGSRIGTITFRLVPPPTFQENSYTTTLKVLVLPRL